MVEDGAAIKGLNTVSLACVDDDAQNETVSVIWDAELDATILADEGGANVSRLGTDDPSVFAAYLRTLRRNTATAADRNLFQAPFRAGIQQDNYQLLPLRKALRLPRVNLLIADDAGAGKTVEASLVLRELLLRRRVDFVLVAAPAGMIRQWQDELETKFGLAFTIVDREYLTSLRKDRGYGAESLGVRIALPHLAFADVRRDLCRGSARTARQLPPALDADPRRDPPRRPGERFAVCNRQPVHGCHPRSRRALRAEHRLFLSATPHNGHSNSFSALLEILDPQRFTAGVPIKPRDLDPILVRRLKSDRRHFGAKFPERKVKPIVSNTSEEAVGTSSGLAGSPAA